MLRYAEQVLLTLWVGSHWSIGYLAVPILFATLDDRILAGLLAGKMFTAVSFIGLGCGFALLLMVVQGSQRAVRDSRVLLLVLMLMLVVMGEFVLQPMMADLKAEGLIEGSEAAARFGMLHGVASLLYLVNSASGLALLFLSVRQRGLLRAGE